MPISAPLSLRVRWIALSEREVDSEIDALDSFSRQVEEDLEKSSVRMKTGMPPTAVAHFFKWNAKINQNAALEAW